MEKDSSTPKFKHLLHYKVWKALEALDAEFLTKACCFFGGGTRLVLELGEYRQSADIDFLCADRMGYRRLREAISQNSLGAIAKSPITLSREVRADRYGIRTFLDIDGEPIKFEIVSEGRVGLDAAHPANLPVPSLDAVSCFAEKFLANADRWADQSVLSRDIIDLAFMIKGWGANALVAGMHRAVEAYGDDVVESSRKAIDRLVGDPRYLQHCARELAITDGRVLRSGLRTLSQAIRGRSHQPNIVLFRPNEDS